MMEANRKFLSKPKSFWATVRTLSQKIGYTTRATKLEPSKVLVPSFLEVCKAFEQLGLDTTKVRNAGNPTEFASELLEYFEYRAKVLNEYVEPRLMTADRAQGEFELLLESSETTCPLPMNKQKGDKKAPAYFTGIVNMLVEKHLNGLGCDYDPRELTTITKDTTPLRTLARRVDGAFPSAVNPKAIWEIKEYYYTTTFGSRIADGVYETLLDGMELEELFEHEGIKVFHYLMIDAHYTWWACGKSYLCRIIDMLNMGYLDEALFGYEVVERMPIIVESWVSE